MNFNFKILTKPYAESLNKSLALWPNLSSQICNKLLAIQSSSSTLATVTTSTSFELPSSNARVTSIKFTQRQLVSQSVSESVSQLVTRVANALQWSDSIKNEHVNLKIHLGKSASCRSEYGTEVERSPQNSNPLVGVSKASGVNKCPRAAPLIL